MRIIRLTQWWRLYVLAFALTIFSTALFAQTQPVKGKVVDETGEPLIGATVRANGTQSVSTTNVNGEFTINVSATTQTITISYVGYNSLEKSITGQGGNLGNIPLTKSSNNLSDVVVVGFGTLRKQDVTGTVASVSGKTLQEIPSANVFEQLKGRVAGLDVVNSPNGPNITIRGNRTIGNPGADRPLIILDGQPYYNFIENINPNDIKSIDVLKGASATAIYGSRASGGVLLITTNRGRVGQSAVYYDSYVGISNFQGKFKLLDGPGYAQLKTDAAEGSLIQNNGVASTYSLTTEERRALAEGISTDWVDLYTKPAVLFDQSLRVSSGNEKTQFNLGLAYRTQNTLEPSVGTKRITLNANIDHRISKLIKVGASIQTSLRLINNSGAGQLFNAQWMSPLAYPYNADGSLNTLPLIGSVDELTLNPLVPTRNPDIFYNYTRGFLNNNIVYAELNPVKHLTYRYTINYNFSQSLQGTYNGINGAGILVTARTNASTVNNYQYRLAQEHLITYDNTFSNKHHINLVGAFTQERQQTENSNSNVTGIPQDAVLNSNLGLGTFVNQGGSYQQQGLLGAVGRLNYTYDNKYNLTATIRSDANSRLSEGNKWITYPSIGLGWVISNESFMKRYSFIDNLKLRAGYGQTSTTESIQPYEILGRLNNANYQYGGVSAGNDNGVQVRTLVNNALTWQRSTEYNAALDFGLFKNRLTGSVEIYSTKTTGVIVNNILPITTGASSQRTNLATSASKGLEITLSSINIQNLGGFSWSTDFNMAFNRERVVELPNGAPFNLGTGLFVGQPLSVIYDLKQIGIWQISDSPGLAANGAYQAVRGQTSPLQYPGQVRVQDLNGDGIINSNDNQIIGNFQPKYTLGLTNRFAYKNFDLNIVIQGRMKFTTVVPYVSSSNSALNGWQYLNLGRHNQPVMDYWTPRNQSGVFPMPNNTVQSPFISATQYFDGSFIRAKSINVGYNLPSKLVSKVGLGSLRVYANVTNPFVIYAPIRNKGFSITDPESVTNAGNQNPLNPASPAVTGNIGGYNPNDANNFPYRGTAISPGLQTRDFIFGINARF
ncbi:SusC/RagA family TonB-linked outer membrane protein [Mucilaginibacter terrae]|uniref:SusC/RagA family TonB-linked outer membrane protein n=1 Tax=Mucilaginibacter terrae TaxID=1955052 RepID=UPI003642CC45